VIGLVTLVHEEADVPRLCRRWIPRPMNWCRVRAPGRPAQGDDDIGLIRGHMGAARPAGGVRPARRCRRPGKGCAAPARVGRAWRDYSDLRRRRAAKLPPAIVQGGVRYAQHRSVGLTAFVLLAGSGPRAGQERKRAGYYPAPGGRELSGTGRDIARQRPQPAPVPPPPGNSTPDPIRRTIWSSPRAMSADKPIITGRWTASSTPFRTRYSPI
jgi:hypothetical protein